MDVLITGIPRSGTTLVAAIADQLPDAVCLSEPYRHVELLHVSTSAEDYAARLVADLAGVRRALVAGEPVSDRRGPQGRLATDYAGTAAPGAARTWTYEERAFTRPGLTQCFLLGAKHNAPYTAVLPELLAADAPKIVAIVRNPLGAIASWRSLDIPATHGRLPSGERYWDDLRTLTARPIDLLEKQIRICELFFRRYLDAGDRIALFRYEDILADREPLMAALGRAGAMSPVEVHAPGTYAAEDTAPIAAVLNALAARGELPGITTLYGEPF